MSYQNGAVIGAAVAFLLYVSVSFFAPIEGKSVFPTAHVINDEVLAREYVQSLPSSMIVFISLEGIGMILGAVGYHIITSSTPKPAAPPTLKK